MNLLEELRERRVKKTMLDEIVEALNKGHPKIGGVLEETIESFEGEEIIVDAVFTEFCRNWRKHTDSKTIDTHEVLEPLRNTFAKHLEIENKEGLMGVLNVARANTAPFTPIGRG